MKSTETFTHNEKMQGLSLCFRQLMETELTHRNMPIIINHAKAVSAIVTASMREEIMEMKRQSASLKLNNSEKPILKLLSKKIHREQFAQQCGISNGNLSNYIMRGKVEIGENDMVDISKKINADFLKRKKEQLKK